MAKQLDTDDMYRLLAEVTLGVPASKSALAPSALVRATRAKLTAEVAAIKASGGTVDVPHEWAAPGTF